jgi:hypothetical protein
MRELAARMRANKIMNGRVDLSIVEFQFRIRQFGISSSSETVNYDLGIMIPDLEMADNTCVQDSMPYSFQSHRRYV